MFDHKTEQQAKELILQSVKEYYEVYRKPQKAFQTGDSIRYAEKIYDEHELMNLVDSALEFWLTAGRYTNKLESLLKEYLDIHYVGLTNSGSSANLLAFLALTSPLVEKKRRIIPGDEVITVAAAFPTTVSPIIQYGAVPVFVDIQIPSYNVDASVLEDALSSKTKAVFLAHTLGNPFPAQRIKDFCNEHGLWLIEDNCDALGAECEVDGKQKKTGTIGDIGTSSFYPAHQMTMGEGGAVYTDNETLFQAMMSFRDWGRDCRCPGGYDNLCGRRYDGQYGELPRGYDHKYVYSHLGYNLKATDLQAAIGCAQIQKLPIFVKKRRHNFKYFTGLLSDMENHLILPREGENASASWFGYPITVKKHGMRNKVVKELELHNIQTRMLFSGNIIRHPCFDEMRKTGKGYRVAGNLENTDRILNDTFWVGLHPEMTAEMLEYMAETIKIVYR